MAYYFLGFTDAENPNYPTKVRFRLLDKYLILGKDLYRLILSRPKGFQRYCIDHGKTCTYLLV